MENLTPAQYARQQAINCARSDAYKSLICDSSRHGALPDSAWDNWYKDEYQKILEDNY